MKIYNIPDLDLRVAYLTRFLSEDMQKEKDIKEEKEKPQTNADVNVESSASNDAEVNVEVNKVTDEGEVQQILKAKSLHYFQIPEVLLKEREARLVGNLEESQKVEESEVKQEASQVVQEVQEVKEEEEEKEEEEKQEVKPKKSTRRRKKTDAAKEQSHETADSESVHEESTNGESDE